MKWQAATIEFEFEGDHERSRRLHRHHLYVPASLDTDFGSERRRTGVAGEVAAIELDFRGSGEGDI